MIWMHITTYSLEIHFNIILPSKIAQAVILTCVLEVLGWNLGWDADCSDTCCDFPQLLQENAGKVVSALKLVQYRFLSRLFRFLTRHQPFIWCYTVRATDIVMLILCLNHTSKPRNEMQLTDQFHAPAALLLCNEPPVTFEMRLPGL
jgi:hypothetical protein